MVALVAGTGLVGLPVLGLGVPSAAAGTSCTAGPLTVTTTADTGTGSLRVAFGNLDPTAGGTICIDTTLVTTPILLTSTTVSYSGSGPVTIDGNGATVEGNNTFLLMFDGSSALLTINGLELTDGSTGTNGGGAILAQGSVTLTGSTITNNSAALGGGGIYSYGSVTVTDSTITNNHTTSDGGSGISAAGSVGVTGSTIAYNTGPTIGGGILAGGSVTLMTSTIANNNGSQAGGIAADGSVTVSNSTIANNIATSGVGGGIWTLYYGSVTVTDSTIAGNTAASYGGGITGDGSVSVTNSTVVSNTSTGSVGGGITDATVTLVYATVAQNSASTGANLEYPASGLTSFGSVVASPQGGGANCAGGGTTTSYGFNLEDDVGASCGFSTGAGDLTPGTASGLGSLANNGGSTLTVAPLVGSTLIDAIPPAHCSDDGASTISPLVDQVGTTRPQGPGCDIGAFEVPNTASQLVFTTEPGNGATGQALSPQPVVAIEDAYGRVVSTDTAPISLTIMPGTGTSGATLSCATNPLNAVAGVAAFTGCAINEAGTGYKLHRDHRWAGGDEHGL